MKKIIYIILGSIFLVLGILGIVLPILPTTPFLLLTAYFFVRSSPQLYRWLINHRIFGVYIYNYTVYKAIPLRAKITAILLLWVMLSISIIIINKTVVTIILLIIGIGVSFHIILLKTLNKADIKEYQRRLINKQI